MGYNNNNTKQGHDGPNLSNVHIIFINDNLKIDTAVTIPVCPAPKQETKALFQPCTQVVNDS